MISTPPRKLCSSFGDEFRNGAYHFEFYLLLIGVESRIFD